MRNNYQNDYICTNIENIEEILKNIVEIISKPSKYIPDKLNFSSTTADITSDESENIDDNEKSEMYSLMESIADLLDEDNFFYDEYFDFCEIQDMIKDTLDRDIIKKSDLMFISLLVLNFSQLISYKMNLKENNTFNVDDYESVYNLFLTKFHESEIYFYENICGETLDDDLFIEYTNIIRE